MNNDVTNDATVRRSVYLVVFVTLFLDLVGFSIIFPVFAHIVAFYSDQESGVLAWSMASLNNLFPEASEQQITALFGGVLFSIYAFLQFLMAPFWGALSDRIGRRPVLIISVAGNIFAYVLWAFAGNFIILLVSRIIAGGMSGNISTASAVVADISPADRRAKAMGIVGAAIGLGFLVGPGLGGLIYTYMPHFEEIHGVFSLNPFSLLAFIAGFLSLINLILIKCYLRETLPQQERTSAPQSERSLRIFSFFSSKLGPHIARMNLIYFLYMLLFAGMESTLVFLAKDFVAYSPGQIGLLFVMIGVIGVIVQGGLIRRLVESFGEKKLMVFGLSIQIPGYVLLSLVEASQSQSILIAGCAFMALGSACLMPSMNSLVSRSVIDSKQGEVMGVFRSVASLGRALGPFIGASCYFFISPASPYYLAGIFLIFPLLLSITVQQPRIAKD